VKPFPDVRRLLARIRYAWRQRQLDDELAEEMAFHREMAERDLAGRGSDPRDASLEASRAFGSSALAHDQARDVWLPHWLQDISHDLRFAVRLFAKERAFAATVVVTLGLSLGVNTTLYSIVSGMENAAPFADASRVSRVTAVDAAGRPAGMSYADVEDCRTGVHSFDEMAAYEGASAILTDKDSAADRLSGVYVSANTFRLVGERPLVGRDFLPDDDRRGAPAVVIISGGIWKTRYGGDPAIVGRSIGVNGVQRTVVGVMPEGFRFPLVHDVWMPLGQMPGIDTRPRDERTLDAVGRLAPGVSIGQARAELSGVAGRLSSAYPATNRSVQFVARRFNGGFDIANPWDIMLGAVTAVLLIACANAANLLLARASHRAGEIAIRASLGATRWRIARQLLVESLLLAALSGVLGLAVGAAGLRIWIASMPPANWPYWYHFAIDRRIVAYLAILTLGSAVVFGLAPAIHVAGRNTADRLHDGPRTGVPLRARRWTRGLLVVEFTLTLSLLAGAGLLGRTLAAVYRTDSAVDTSHLAIASVSLAEQRYASPEARSALFEQLEERLGHAPGIRSAALAGALPFFSTPIRAVTFRDPVAVASTPHASYVAIGSRYFDTMGLRLVAGRAFNGLDGTAGHEAAIVNQRFAAIYLAHPLGAQIRLEDPDRPDASAGWMPIVGVAPNVRQQYAQELDAVVYVPYRSSPPPGMSMIVRTAGDPAAIGPVLREEMRRLDPDLPLFNILPLDQMLAGSRFANQVFATLFAVFALTALLLAAVGLHAVVSYAVSERTREIGVRMALGARPAQVVWLFIRTLMSPLAVGIALGLAGAFVVGRFVRGLLTETSPSDPATLAAIVVVLAVVAVAAAARPARRAAGLDPLLALRHE
jgi:predicted permease